MKQKVVVIVGPTAAGKSSLAVRLAKKHNGEIISADSRQIYTGLNLGTGKITEQEMKGVPHHLLDIWSPKKVVSASDYKQKAEQTLHEIAKRNKLPIIVGGTGFYIDVLLGRIETPEVPPDKKLRKYLEKKTTPALFTILTKLDKSRSKTIDQNNRVRLIRTIEIAKAIGASPKNWRKKSNYDILWIGVNSKNLSNLIEKRLRERIKKGMLREVKSLHAQGLSWKRMEELGLEYRYLSRLARGILSPQETKTELLKEINRYAKRQMTWFKKNKKIKWFDPKAYRDIETYTRNMLG